MKFKRGYYSLIQFCPNPSRLETVNVGVVLLCPDAGFIDARTSANNQPAARLVGRGKLDIPALNSAKQAIEHRLQVDRASFKSHEDLQAFVNTRGNNLKLTDPRPVKVCDPPKDLDKLFEELVGGRLRTQQKTPLSPQLEDVFHRLDSEGLARLDLSVNVPVLDRSLRIPYAYHNGVLNLVKPQQFSVEEKTAIKTAMQLAMEGDLLRRHPGPEGKNKLIVVSLFSHNGDTKAVPNRVGELLREYKVENVQEDEISQFVIKVEREAHAA